MIYLPNNLALANLRLKAKTINPSISLYTKFILYLRIFLRLGTLFRLMEDYNGEDQGVGNFTKGELVELVEK